MIHGSFAGSPNPGKPVATARFGTHCCVSAKYCWICLLFSVPTLPSRANTPSVWVSVSAFARERSGR